MSVYSSPIPILGSALGMNFGGMLGWQEQHIGELNRNLFVVIQDKKESVSVRGRIVSYSVSNSAEWQNKFEGQDADGRYPMLAAIAQSGIWSDKLQMIDALQGRTLISSAQSIQVWTGLMPQEVSLEIEFRAFSNALLEVERPIQALLRMQAPILNKTFIDSAQKAIDNLNSDAGAVDKFVKEGTKEEKTTGETQKRDTVLGYTPNKISIDFLGKRFNNIDYRIENVTEAVDGLNIDRNGNRVHQIVSMTFGSSIGIMKDDVNTGSVNNLLKTFDDILSTF